MSSQRERLKQIVSRITYKPGWKFMVGGNSSTFFDPIGFDSVNLTISHLVPDVNDPTVLIPISTYRAVSPEILESMDDESVVREFIYYAIKNLEIHEIDEWLKLDGKSVYDPHPQEPTVEMK